MPHKQLYCYHIILYVVNTKQHVHNLISTHLSHLTSNKSNRLWLSHHVLQTTACVRLLLHTSVSSKKRNRFITISNNKLQQTQQQNEYAKNFEWPLTAIAKIKKKQQQKIVVIKLYITYLSGTHMASKLAASGICQRATLINSARLLIN